MPKCKVCGYRLGDGVAKCPMCGAEAGSTVVGNVNPTANLQKSYCPSCGNEVLGKHRYCPSCGADLKNDGNTAAAHAVAHAANSAQSQRVQTQAQTAPQKQSSAQAWQNSQISHQQIQKPTQQNSQHSESQGFQQVQQNVVEQKDKAEPNKTAFWILMALTLIFVIHNAIWNFSKGESLFQVIAGSLFGSAILTGFHVFTCLSDSLSKGARKKAVIIDSILIALFYAIEFGLNF